MNKTEAGAGVTDWTRWVRDVPDFPQSGILFRDLTPLWSDGTAWSQAVDCLARRIVATTGIKPQYVLGVEARGFLVAQALADRWGSGVLLARKPGKLPRRTHRESYQLEYGEAELEMHDDAIAPQSSVLVADDVLATGGTAAAALRLSQKLGGKVIGIAFVIELQALGGRERLGSTPVTSLITYNKDDTVDLLS